MASCVETRFHLLSCWYCDELMASDSATLVQHEFSEQHQKWKAIAQAVIGMMEGRVTVDILRERYSSLVFLTNMAHRRVTATGCDDYAKIIFEELEAFLRQRKTAVRKRNPDKMTVDFEVKVTVEETRPE